MTMLIHFFHESLSGVALTWYMSLDGSKIKKCKDPIEAVMRQYKASLEVALNRLSL